MSLDPVTLTLAMTLASQGMRMWADFAERAVAGQTTDDELDIMAEKLGVNIAEARVEVAEARAAGR